MKASRGIRAIMIARKNGARITTTYQFNEDGICHGAISTSIMRGVMGVDVQTPTLLGTRSAEPK